MAKQIEEKENTAHSRNNWYSTNSGGRGLAYGAGAVIVLLIVFMLGAAAAGHHRVYRTGGFYGGGPGPVTVGMGRGERVFMHSGNFGGTVTDNGQTRTTGVVTAVNGSSFTLAGNGATTNVTTNGSTQYQNGNTVKVNDTVMVVGTTSNNTLTATSVVINP